LLVTGRGRQPLPPLLDQRRAPLNDSGNCRSHSSR